MWGESCEHPCPHCWLTARRQVVGRWLFHHMPVAWRHQRVMRAAMRQRREWREGEIGADPRQQHAFRRHMRALDRELTAVWSAAIMSALHGATVNIPCYGSLTGVERPHEKPR